MYQYLTAVNVFLSKWIFCDWPLARIRGLCICRLLSRTKHTTNKIAADTFWSHCAEHRNKEEVGPYPRQKDRAEEKGSKAGEELQSAEKQQERGAQRCKGTGQHADAHVANRVLDARDA